MTAVARAWKTLHGNLHRSDTTSVMKKDVIKTAIFPDTVVVLRGLHREYDWGSTLQDQVRKNGELYVRGILSALRTATIPVMYEYCTNVYSFS